MISQLMIMNAFSKLIRIIYYICEKDIINGICASRAKGSLEQLTKRIKRTMWSRGQFGGASAESRNPRIDMKSQRRNIDLLRSHRSNLKNGLVVLVVLVVCVVITYIH